MVGLIQMITLDTRRGLYWTLLVLVDLHCNLTHTFMNNTLGIVA